MNAGDASTDVTALSGVSQKWPRFWEPRRTHFAFRHDGYSRYNPAEQIIRGNTDMKSFTVLAAAVMAAAFLGLVGAGAALADCTPLKSDVVSVGEASARFYSDRSLANAIDDERQRVAAFGRTVAKVSTSMDCKPFPNLIGADEWRCIGAAKVCAR